MCYQMSRRIHWLQIHQFLAALGEGSKGLALWWCSAPPDVEGALPGFSSTGTLGSVGASGGRSSPPAQSRISARLSGTFL